ncbi:dynein axonemal heavy chain 11 isoform X5 [Taeniopygia guttata]|uniref:dynein axonemal heavy chain 11 isoform X5 n=1 Tax=Taeniopygia guttata TaxID=59729 RepID=UPI003BB8F399
MLRRGFVFHTFRAAQRRMRQCRSIGTRRCEGSRIPSNPAALPSPPPAAPPAGAPPPPRGRPGGETGPPPLRREQRREQRRAPAAAAGTGRGSHPRGHGNAGSIDDWTKTQWQEINVEQMDEQLRGFAKAAFSCRRPSQTFWESSFIRVEDEVQSVVVNAVQELSSEKKLVTDITDKENVMEATRKPKVYESFEALQQSRLARHPLKRNTDKTAEPLCA